MVGIADSDSVVVLALDDLRFGLSMNTVERVIRAVEISPLPDAPPGVVGVINVHGRIIPVFDIRARFGLAPREMRLSDHFVIGRAGLHPVALLVDAAVDVVPGAYHSALDARPPLAGVDFIEGLMMQGEHVIPIQDLGRFLPQVPTTSCLAPELKLVA